MSLSCIYVICFLLKCAEDVSIVMGVIKWKEIVPFDRKLDRALVYELESCWEAGV